MERGAKETVSIDSFFVETSESTFLKTRTGPWNELFFNRDGMDSVFEKVHFNDADYPPPLHC